MKTFSVIACLLLLLQAGVHNAVGQVGEHLDIFVLRKKGSKAKEKMKEEEIEKGDCGPPTRKVFFWFCRT